MALVANAKLTSSSTFRCRRDWSEPHNLGINFPVRHFSSSLQNADSSEKLNGLLYYQNSIFFQLSASGGLRPPDHLIRGSASGPRGSAPGSRWGLCPQTPVIGSRSALAMSPPHCSEEIASVLARSKDDGQNRMTRKCKT